MHLQTETVTETVAKEVSISALLNVVARDGVGIPPGHSGANAIGGVLVRRAADLNAYDLLQPDRLVFTQAAFNRVLEAIRS
jgi:ribosomal protein L4